MAFQRDFQNAPARSTYGLKWAQDGSVAVMLEDSVCILRPTGQKQKKKKFFFCLFP